MCRGETAAEDCRAARPSSGQAARVVLMVACRRCSRRNATGRCDTGGHPCSDRTVGRNDQRNAVAVFAETLEAAVEANSKRREKVVRKTCVTGLLAAGVLLGQATGQQELSVADVENMLAAQVPSDVIVLKVKQAHATFSLSTADILALKKAGASDDLLKVMISGESGSAAEAQGITVPDGTEVKLLLKNPLSSATAQPEQRMEFTASEAVAVHGVTVIEKGAPAVGHVTEAQPAKGFGRKGKLNFSIDTVQSTSGENIRLRSSKTATGSDSYGKAGVVTILTGPFGALVKGKDIEVPAGTEFTIYIDGERKVQQRSAGKQQEEQQP